MFYSSSFSFLFLALALVATMEVSTGIEIENSKTSTNTYSIGRELAATLNDSNTALENVNIIDYERYAGVENFDILTMTSLTRIPKFILLKFKHLRSLRIIDAGIQFLSPETFADGKLLHDLDLRRNKFYSLSEGVFSSLKNLQYLNLALNTITTIDENTFTGLDSLKYLYLSDNKLTKVTSKTFAGVPNLQELLLDKNEIEAIEFDDLSLPKLEILSVNNNNIRTLPSLRGFPQLEKVHFAGNKVTRLGDTFDQLKSLYMLDVNNNPNLQDIDLVSITTRLPGLTYLLISRTGYKFPDSDTEVCEGNGSDLRKLDLSKNSLSDTNVFKRLACFKEMKEIDLSENQFERFSIDNIDTLLPHLERLNIKHNPLDASWLDEVLPILKAKDIEVRV